ncbi:sporulation protein YabP [Clostridium sp. LY3-2]|uniref:sporulation protein YabP n=1 Tax=Clostridium sp. LY3-2 TaxID=2942482 RepID=UPI002152BE8F|nr:sporulation protein YabP [Clostridium sp. LY3-2]MCR6515036.1 sporulation protein YabP [Clostridium sp. LY3-2]
MDNKKEISNKIKKSGLTLEERKIMTLTGVLEVVSFYDEKIILSTILGRLVIKGQGLKMDKLDIENSDVIIRGYINSFVYNGKVKKKEKRSFLKKFLKKGE